MSSVKSITLNEAIKVARRLPQNAQDALAKEVMEHIEDLTTPKRSSQRQAVIKKRLENPLKATSRQTLMGTLKKYNPGLWG